MEKKDVQLKPIDWLKPYDKNARTHSPDQIKQIVASIKQWGWTNPILTDEEGLILAGHGRLSAAKKMRLKQVPVIVMEGWPEDKKRAYILADNQLALNAGWDLDLLRDELLDLKDFEFDLGGLGFDLGEDKRPKEGLTDPDEVPAEPETPVSKLGDIWVMGGHRIVCGDSTSAETVAALLNGEKPHLMVTDPPYGVEYSAGWRNEAMPQKNDPERWKDGSGSPTGAVLNDNRADWSEAWELFKGDVTYVWHADLHAKTVVESLEKNGFQMRAQIVWAKQQFAIGRGDYHHQHEPCWYAVRKGQSGKYVGGRKQSTLWQIDKPQKSETGHSTQKPVECMKRPIENNSKAGDSVYEPFSGSGTTIIAGEMTGRRVYAIELNPAYVDMAVRRWEAFSGGVATLEATGHTFDEVADSRLLPHAAAE